MLNKLGNSGAEYTFTLITPTDTYSNTVDLGSIKYIKFLSVYSDIIYSSGNSSVQASTDNQTFTSVYSNHLKYNQALDIGYYRYIKFNIRMSGGPTNNGKINIVYK